MHRKKLKVQMEGCGTVKSLDPDFKRAVKGAMSDPTECAGVRRPRQCPKKTVLDRFYDQEVFRENEVGHCSLLKERETLGREIQPWKAVSAKRPAV